MGKSRGERVNGVLLLDKPGGMTSNAALQAVRRLLNAAKAGHTGTLDPMATGLLPLTFGEATKFSADLLNADKSYRATLQLGITTSTGDADGEVIDRRDVAVSSAQLDATLSRFIGDVEQVPPMHSALKRDGQPLYKLAREGAEVERTPRRITVHRLTLVEQCDDSVVVDVDCSKGTYVRVLAEDIGRVLGCGAHLTALRRTRAGRLSVDDAATLSACCSSSLVRARISARRAGSSSAAGPDCCTAAAAAPPTRAAPLNPSPRPIGIGDRIQSDPVPPARRKATSAG